MKYVLKLEQLAIFLFSIYLYSDYKFNGWIFLVLFFTPDLSMIGYLFGNRVGAVTYNFVHHQAVALAIFILGQTLDIKAFAIYGLVMLGHSSLDRVLGFGLKTFKGFKETHLAQTPPLIPPL